MKNLIKKESDKVDLNFLLNLDTIMYHGEELKMMSPIQVMGNIYAVNEQLYLTCTYEGKLEVNCGRCLEPFIHAFYSRINAELMLNDQSTDEEEEDDVLFYEDNTIDLEKVVVDQLIISLPMKLICDNDCKGLCSQCGKSLNKEICQCTLAEDHDVDPRLTKLKKLLQQD
ncbi:YceD family protein [Alkaliphilus metalliredigens]|uniref:YceD family protein n=1 Tax=Alkaliphilus metalliredigens TaxID=208226 RepID=UPI0012ED82C8|nr:DUF177 domain-containing protein [Alkaliphilus metalliredigens]